MTRTVQQLFDLSGKTALVTGGSRGLGLQLAQSLGEAGAKVLLSSRKAADLEESVAILKKAGIDAQFIAADCADEHDIQRLGAASMKALGHVDILVNNAGAAWGAPAEDHPIDAWDKVTAAKSTENAFFKRVMDSQRAFAQRAGSWQNDYMVDFKMAWNRYFRQPARPAAQAAPAKKS